jgi:hypothetical protein
MSGSSVVPCKWCTHTSHTVSIDLFAMDYDVVTDDTYAVVMLVVLGRSGWREIR